MTNEIPSTKRAAVHLRDGRACQRCGMKGAEVHHRRPRNVKGDHDPHCTCNLIYLCHGDHRWATENPMHAVLLGFSVRRTGQSHLTPFERYDGLWVQNDCSGGLLIDSSATNLSHAIYNFHRIGEKP